MSHAMSVKSLTVLASLAVFGNIWLAPVGASAAALSVHVSPSIGHPVWIDLRDQIRYPQIQAQTLTDDINPVIHGGHPPVHIIPPPGHSKQNHRN